MEAGVKKNNEYATIQAFTTKTQKEAVYMATETLTSRTARIALNNGTDSSGNTLVVYDNLSGLSGTASNWDADKYLAIVGALEPCLNKIVETIQTTAVYSVTAS